MRLAWDQFLTRMTLSLPECSRRSCAAMLAACFQPLRSRIASPAGGIKLKGLKASNTSKVSDSPSARPLPIYVSQRIDLCVQQSISQWLTSGINNDQPNSDQCGNVEPLPEPINTNTKIGQARQASMPGIPGLGICFSATMPPTTTTGE